MSKFATYTPLAYDEIKHDPATGQFTPNGSAGKKAERLAKATGGKADHFNNVSIVNATGGNRRDYHATLTQKHGFGYERTVDGPHAKIHKFSHPEGHEAAIREWNGGASGEGTSLDANFHPKAQKPKTTKVAGWR